MATKVPKSFGAAADLLYKTRQERYAVQKKIDALAALESDIKEYLINNMPKSKQSGAAGKLARAQIEKEVEPVVEDWDKFYGNIRKTGAFDLMNRAINRKAIKERWEDGKKIPGVGTYTVLKLSVTKL